MLADPRHSRVVLINPSRGASGKPPAEFTARWHESLSLLSFVWEMFGVIIYAIGEYDLMHISRQAAGAITLLDIDGLSLWRDQGFIASLAASNVGVVFLGGAWLEEEVFIAALEGARRGYDVRLLADLSVARLEADRSLVFDRLALYGIPITTVRQALLEWAVSLDDPILRQQVQGLLS